MGGSIPQLVLSLLATGVLGIVAGLLIGALINKRRIGELSNAAQAKLDDVSLQRDELATELSRSRSKIEPLQAAVADGRTRFESALKKSKSLARNVIALRAERENTKIKLGTMQASLVSVKQQTVSLQTEFDKVGEFYKGELVKSFEKRKLLEQELENTRSEQESFARLVESSVLEHGSPDEMITAAQLRFGQLEMLQRSVKKLEAENTALRDAATRMKRESEAMERDLAQMDELRINNQQLVRCVESLESSRKQHENDAERYRDDADQSEQLSETLRLKLSDMEKNFADMEQQQQQALKHVRKAAVVPTQGAKNTSGNEVDDLQEIANLSHPSKRSRTAG